MKRFIPYFKMLKEVKVAFIAALLCGMVFGVASGFGLPYVTQKVFPVLFGGQPVGEGMLIVYLLIMPLAFAIRGLSGFFNTYFISYCGTSILNRLRARVFVKLQDLPLLAYQRHATGDLLTRATNDTAQLQNTIISVSNDLIKYPVTFVSAIGALIYMSIQHNQLMFLLVLLVVIPICIFPIRYLGNLLQKRTRDSQSQVASVIDILNENIRGVREVRLYGQEKHQAQRFQASIDALLRFTMKLVKYQASLNPILEFITAIGVTVAIYFAYQAQLKLEVVLPLILALYMSYEPLKKIGAVHNSLKQGSASLERIEDLLSEPVGIEDPINPVPVDRVTGNITLTDVRFSYPRGDRVAVNGLSFSVPSGRVVGIVGPSGAGKSTLLNLLPRLFDPQGGSLFIDGIDIRQMRLTDLRRQIAVVPQEAFLFNDTVRANIALGDPNATAEKIEAAARRAQAHQFIMAMPRGYDTIVGEAGGQLSGGQRQRLAIARAFYKDAPILLLDEPTSALDSENENEIFSSIKALTEGRTSLIVSHRLKSLHFCHQIIYLEEGRLIAYDTHENLMAHSEGYRKLYQASEAGILTP